MILGFIRFVCDPHDLSPVREIVLLEDACDPDFNPDMIIIDSQNTKYVFDLDRECFFPYNCLSGKIDWERRIPDNWVHVRLMRCLKENL